jgi:hypothetical protein
MSHVHEIPFTSVSICANNAPDLTEWVTVVADRLDQPCECVLAVGRSFAGTGVPSKVRGLGITDEASHAAEPCSPVPMLNPPQWMVRLLRGILRRLPRHSRRYASVRTSSRAGLGVARKSCHVASLFRLDSPTRSAVLNLTTVGEERTWEIAFRFRMD